MTPTEPDETATEVEETEPVEPEAAPEPTDEPGDDHTAEE